MRPVVLEGDGIEASWRPENSHGDFSGPMRLREALVKSRNLVSIRLLRELGTPYTIDYVTRFGFDKRALPQNLTLALGTVQATPWRSLRGTRCLPMVAIGLRRTLSIGLRMRPGRLSGRRSLGSRARNARSRSIWATWC